MAEVPWHEEPTPGRIPTRDPHPPGDALPEPLPHEQVGETRVTMRDPQSLDRRFAQESFGPERPGAAEANDTQLPWNPIRQLREALSAGQGPAPDRTVKLPLAASVPADAVRVDPQTGLVSIIVRNAPLGEILALLAEHEGLNLITAEDIAARVSITLVDVPFADALGSILSVAGYTYVEQRGVLLVTSIAADRTVGPEAQGREVRVFRLNYVSASDVDAVIQGLLSPSGQSFVTQTSEADMRKTHELIVVEDLPWYLHRIEQTIWQLDRPPRQVLIEAHVLSVELEDECEHGIDFAYLDFDRPVITLETTGFADPTASPAFMLDLDETSFKALLDALKTTTDAKTLASPKVYALNGQQARIQIGEQLGYRVTTTTQTSTLESVDFLEVGVILTVTPCITPDNKVIMQVRPQVSNGQVNELGLPEEETTEVDTSVLLEDGHGIVIGGLIQEEDVETQQKVPFVGDMWLIGRLFQRRTVRRKRTEIIIAMIPRVLPYQPECYEREFRQLQRATTPLVYGPLCKYPRPYEPRFPDAGQRPGVFYPAERPCTAPPAVTPMSPAAQPVPYSDVPAAPPWEPAEASAAAPQPGEILVAPVPRQSP